MKKASKKFLSMFIAVVIMVNIIAFTITNVSAESQRDAIVRIALAEVGTSGCPNKYTYAYGQIGGSYNWGWCAAFIYWCAQQAGIPNSIIGRTASASVNSFNTPYYAYSSGCSVKKGDILYLTNNYGNHVGLVYNVDSTYIYTVEGNMGNAVKKYQYRRSDGYITWSNSSEWQRITHIGTPKYVENTDKQAPTISNIKYKMTTNGFIVSCTVTDNVGVTRVQFPTWTDKNGQDDIVWHEGTISGSTATCNIPISSHKNEYGSYIVHIYAFDAAGNSSVMGSGFNVSIFCDSNELAVNGTYNLANSKTITARGWAFNAGGGTTDCYYSIDGKARVLMAKDNRPDVINTYTKYYGSNFCKQTNCGYSTAINIESLSAGKHTIVVTATCGNNTVEVDRKEFTVVVPSYTFDLNALLDGTKNGTLGNYGTADVYINGKLVANDVNDYCQPVAYGSTYEIKDIKAANGKAYNGVASGGLSGTVKANSEVVLNFSTKPQNESAPSTPTQNNCKCICHKTDVFSKFIYRIVLVFWDLFGIKQVCDCGEYHYKAPTD